jgi:hypothetical protein
MCPVTDASDEERLAQLAHALADGVEAALPVWVERSVSGVLVAYAGHADPEVMALAREAGSAARDDVGPRLRALLDADVDEQWTNPLSIVRTAVTYPTSVLHEAEVPAVVRDEAAEGQFPDDDYDLTPTRFADLAPELHELSLAWGAAKAFVMKRRHTELNAK